ncbi:ATP-binding cassette domain-containing protein [candidate division WOR-3 bacterium]|uniref:ATP-binding cassette domain-containing protein n=1 Tax=candidate division WOR-3 bacterium TaxID=2052148 RepID=A0A9D5QEV8_UNCW3|nr:ATP-binding cassette domain-containing protein [candidate division WOR-3 bacterium]MBD3365400.1 ATP-binding cassette domain-containing protein [candidate division WOR-3 bacterium]
MLHVRNLSVSFGSAEVLEGISLDLNHGEVLIVTGPNGSGKSTLLKCIAGEIEYSDGSIDLDKSVSYILLEQETPKAEGSAIQFLLKGFPVIYKVYNEMKTAAPESSAYADAVTAFADGGGYELQSELVRIAAGFGFSEGDLDRGLVTFSEGEKKILAFVRLLAGNANLMLLDEPMNHLDISMRVFAEKMIISQKKKGRCFLIVSHDRIFTDRIADRTLYLQREKGVTVNGGISQMLSHLELELDAGKKKAADIERKIKKLEAEVAARAVWAGRKERSARKQRKLYDGAYLASRAARMAKRSKAAETRRERSVTELENTKPFIEKRLNLSFDTYEVSKRLIVKAQGLSKGYEKPVIENVSLSVTTRDRIALIGPNGSGKTTIMRCLLTEIEPDKGIIHLSKYVKYLYLPQEIEKFFRRDILLDNLTREGLDTSRVRQFLGAAKLSAEQVLRPVSTLSRGELMRAAIVSAIIDKVDFLFLDEPTNHLDIESLIVLDNLLNSFPGGVLFISHDRSFIAQHAEKVYRLSGNNLKPCSL